MQVEKCSPYHAVIEDVRQLCQPDGKSVFKIYYVSIVGRDNPARFEWSHTPLSKAQFEANFQAGGHEGIGFVTAFPHITKVFRYAPKAEILMLVKAYNTQTGQDINLDRGEKYMEFACLAEAIIAAAEYRFWGEAATVQDYLAQTAALEDAPIHVHDKLKTYWEK